MNNHQEGSLPDNRENIPIGLIPVISPQLPELHIDEGQRIPRNATILQLRQIANMSHELSRLDFSNAGTVEEGIRKAENQ